MGTLTSDIEVVLAYHARTRHRPGLFARGPDGLDWANQPDPFRRFEGTLLVPLPFARPTAPVSFDSIGEAIEPSPVTLNSLSRMLELSLAISAWKQIGSTRWALRCNPSSGNLHPTEAYLILPTVPGIDVPGVYHYRSIDHSLERRCQLPTDVSPSAPGTFIVGLSSVHWREAWKYGERAYRYCQHDVGHALAAVVYACATLGWTARVLPGPSDDDVAALLGLNREGDFADAEREDADLLLLVDTTPGRRADRRADGPDAAVIADVKGAAWFGRANRLSPEHVQWMVIDDVTAAAHKHREAPAPQDPAPVLPRPIVRQVGPCPNADDLILQRRSAMAFDGTTWIDRATFVAMLDRLLPRRDVVPFGALQHDAAVHLLLFVHRVRDLAPGLYALVRTPMDRSRLEAAMHQELAWEKVEDTPEYLPFFRLSKGDLKQLAQALSCHQDIAADAAFSVAMLVALDESLARDGAWTYRRLHWEAGIVGQVLYLEAERAGLRGTGIGCFFDDLVRDLVGLAPGTWQSIYHFAVGMPVEDMRLTTLPAYDCA